MRWFQGLAAGLGLALAAHCPISASAQGLDCARAVAQVEMNACAELGWKDADQVLNALWPQVRRKAQDLDGGLPKGQRGIWQAMLDGQRAWLTYRDKHCEAEGGPMRGGSAEPLLIYGCMQRLTEDRVRVLRGFLE